MKKVTLKVWMTKTQATAMQSKARAMMTHADINYRSEAVAANGMTKAQAVEMVGPDAVLFTFEGTAQQYQKLMAS